MESTYISEALDHLLDLAAGWERVQRHAERLGKTMFAEFAKERAEEAFERAAVAEQQLGQLAG